MPWPSRSRDVRAATAARKTSGAEEWLYSSRKWCSTTQAVWMPMRSASSHCSTALASTVASASSSQGRGPVGDAVEAEGGELDVERPASAAQLAAALTDQLRELHGPPRRMMGISAISAGPCR